jgi:hypothetical protein
MFGVKYILLISLASVRHDAEDAVKQPENDCHPKNPELAGMSDSRSVPLSTTTFSIPLPFRKAFLVSVRLAVMVTGEDDIWKRAPCTIDSEGSENDKESLKPGGTFMRTSAMVSPEEVLKSSELASAGMGRGRRMMAATASASEAPKPFPIARIPVDIDGSLLI